MERNIYEQLQLFLNRTDDENLVRAVGMFLDVMRKEVSLDSARLSWRYEMSISKGDLEILLHIIENTPEEQSTERYALAECAYGLAVNNADLDMRNQLGLTLGNAAVALGLVERFRFAYSELVSGLRVRKEFFQSDGDKVQELIDSFMEKWRDVASRLRLKEGLYVPLHERPLSLTVLESLLWNLDKGESKGLTTLIDTEIRLGHMLQELMPRGDDAPQLVGEILDLIAGMAAEEGDDWHGLKCCLCLGGALMRVGSFSEASVCFERAMASDSLSEKEPLWLNALARWTFCATLLDELELARNIAANLDEENARNSSGLIIAYAAEYGRFLVARKLLLILEGVQVDEKEYDETITGYLTQATMMVDQEVGDKTSYLRSLYFSALMREVNWMHATVRARLDEEGFS